MYAFESCKDLHSLRNLKVLSFGCGPCTDLFAIDCMCDQNILAAENIEYRGIDYCRDVWRHIHHDIELHESSSLAIRYYYEDACTLIHQIADGRWIPNLITFQYVFSDMQKHSGTQKVEEFLDVFAEYCNTRVPQNSYIVINDVNLGCDYEGGREHFDSLLGRLEGTEYRKGRFHNDNASGFYFGGFPYGNDSDGEFPRNINRFSLQPWSRYSPFDTCASAQMIIKKVM